MTMLQFIFLQNAAPNLLQGIWPLLLIPVIFYFFIYRPQSKRQDEQKKLLENLKEGMEVVTSAGIIGRITKIDGNIVRLMVDEKTFIRVVKQTITGEYKA